MRPHPRWLRSRALRALSPLVPLLFVGACNEDPTYEVTAGTIGGISFTVVSGTVTQPVTDGPIAADSAGALITLSEPPAGLGSSDPARLHLVTRFALSNGGSLGIAAFGSATDPLGSGALVNITRDLNDFNYIFLLSGTQVAQGQFLRPSEASAEHAIVSEFYAQDVPGYGTGTSGATAWGIDDEAPAFGNDVLACTSSPALQATTLPGSVVAFELRAAFLTQVAILDTIIGPCI